LILVSVLGIMPPKSLLGLLRFLDVSWCRHTPWFARNNRPRWPRRGMGEVYRARDLKLKRAVEITQAQNRVNNRIQNLREQANIKLIRAWLCPSGTYHLLASGRDNDIILLLGKP
jgi:hypothetical protein